MKKLISSLSTIFFLLAFAVLNVQAQKPVTAPYIELVRQNSTPATPNPNRDRVYVSAGGSVFIINSDGTASGLGGSASDATVIKFQRLEETPEPPPSGVDNLYVDIDGNLLLQRSNGLFSNVGGEYVDVGLAHKTRLSSSLDSGSYQFTLADPDGLFDISLNVDQINLATRLTRNGTTAILGDGIGLEKDSFLVWSRLSSFPWSAVSQAIGDDDGIDVGLKRVSRNNLKVVGSDLTTAGNLSVGAILPRRKSLVLPDGGTTIDASGCNTVTVTADPVAVAINIDTISNGVDGQQLTILPGDTLVTIDDLAAVNIKLKSGSWNSADGKALTLVFDGTFWWEI